MKAITNTKNNNKKLMSMVKRYIKMKIWKNSEYLSGWPRNRVMLKLVKRKSRMQIIEKINNVFMFKSLKFIII